MSREFIGKIMFVLTIGLALGASPATAKEIGVTTEIATFGGGCFWCLEAIFEEVQGVQRVVSGYAGGDAPDPTYEQVCAGRTGHAEVVQVRFDPLLISYAQLLEVFFTSHDPTTLNRQGSDIGPQYRSVVLAEDEKQERATREFIELLTAERVFETPIVTEIAPLRRFYPAESYHQNFFRRNREKGYCLAVINPKLQQFREKHQDLLR